MMIMVKMITSGTPTEADMGKTSRECDSSRRLGQGRISQSDNDTLTVGNNNSDCSIHNDRK